MDDRFHSRSLRVNVYVKCLVEVSGIGVFTFMYGVVYNFLFGKEMLKSLPQSMKMSNSRKGIFKFYLSMIKHCRRRKYSQVAS